VIRKLVANDPETSAAVVGLYCKMAKEDPMYFQLASIIAAAYNIEFDDDTLMVTVRQAQTPPGSKPMPPLGFQPEKGKNQ
jgi:hypothetical protein